MTATSEPRATAHVGFRSATQVVRSQGGSELEGYLYRTLGANGMTPEALASVRAEIREMEVSALKEAYPWTYRMRTKVEVSSGVIYFMVMVVTLLTIYMIRHS